MGGHGGVVAPRDQQQVAVMDGLSQVEATFRTVDPLDGPAVFGVPGR